MTSIQTSDSRMSSLLSQVLSLETPALLMQSDPRQVVTANPAACRLFNKDLSRIEGFRGGQVFDCIHSFSEAGCGKDPNCEACLIKNAVVDTFNNGHPQLNVSTVLTLQKDGSTAPYKVVVSTEKKGDHALMKIEKYEPAN